MIDPSPVLSRHKVLHQPARLGFAGVGWIGRHRMDAAVTSGLARVASIAEPVKRNASVAAASHPDAMVVGSFEEMLEMELDGIVIATPSALHSSQAIAALERGIPVFCQKPLGRNAAETSAVITAARRADRLLGVDLSYRFTTGMQRIRDMIRGGELGNIISIEAVFHNAYGPDKEWFYSRKCAGGGCLLDLGIHMIDLALWSLDYPEIESAHGCVHQSARGACGDRVEDHANGFVRIREGAALQLACSWGSHAGCDAEIRMQFFGTRGGACFRNVGGSFYDFIAERFHADRSRELLAEPPDDWGGRAVLDWLACLQRSKRFDPEICHLEKVATTLDHLYLDIP
jgi:predicted dehydrogenase